MKKEYIEYLKNEVKLEILGKVKTSNDHHRLKCLLCENIIKVTPKSKVANFKKYGLAGCPKCTQKERYQEYTEKAIKRLKDMGYILLTDFKGKNKPITVINSKCSCGRSWTTQPERIFTGRSFCRPCNDDRKRKFFQDLNEERFRISLIGKEGYDQYQSEVRVLTERTYRENEEYINPNGHRRGLSGTEDAYHLDHIISIKYCFSNNIPVEVCAHRDNLQIIPWKSNAVKWKRPSNMFPKIFWKYIDKYDEKRNFIKKVKSEIKSFKIFKHTHEFNYELDLINRKEDVGVIIHRFDDIMEQTVGTKKHLSNITEYFRGVGIRVVHVFQHEWLDKPDLVIRRLRHIVNENSQCKKIYARKCIIGDVHPSQKSKLLNENHVQGNDNASVSLGAYHDGELVAVMTFAKSRVFMKGKVTDKIKWELSRFATDTGYVVVGIASKLLKHFMKNYDWDEIYSFADLRWSDRKKNVYLSLGFEKKSSSLAYHYIVDGDYKHRWNYQKKQLKKKFPDEFDSTLTEYENMKNFGYDRVWDCGMMKYVMHNI